VPTKGTTDNSTNAASTAYVTTAIANVLNGESYTGTQDFTSATLKASTQGNLINDTTVATTAYVNTAVTNLKSTANTWTQAQDFSGGTTTITVPTRIISDNSTNAASTAFVRSCITNIEAGNTWTGSQSFTGANITCATQLSSDNSTKVATTAFVKANSSSSVSLGGNNVWTGNNTFNLGSKFGISTGTTQIEITSDTIKSALSNDTINLFNTNTTGTINMASNLIFKASSIASSGIADTISLFSNLTTGTLNLATGITTGAINIATTSMTSGIITIGTPGSGTTKLNGKVNFGTSQISGYSSFISTSANYTVPTTINNEFFIYGGGASAHSIFLPSYIAGQKFYIRNAIGSGNILNITAQTGQSIILPAGSAGQTYTMPNNTGLMLYSDGTIWIAMLKY